MRSSRRNQGLQPEMNPEDSNSEDSAGDHASVGSEDPERNAGDVAPDTLGELVASSDDVNLDESTSSKATSEAEVDEVHTTSS